MSVYLPDDVTARLFVALELEHVACFGFFQQFVERAEAVIGFVETGLAAFERLFHHRAPDFFLLPALGSQRFYGLEDQIERFLLFAVVRWFRRLRRGGARFGPGGGFLRGGALACRLLAP